MPDTFLRNDIKGNHHEIVEPNNYIRIFPDGKVLYSVRYFIIRSICLDISGSLSNQVTTMIFNGLWTNIQDNHNNVLPDGPSFVSNCGTKMQLVFCQLFLPTKRPEIRMETQKSSSIKHPSSDEILFVIDEKSSTRDKIWRCKNVNRYPKYKLQFLDSWIWNYNMNNVWFVS